MLANRDSRLFSTLLVAGFLFAACGGPPAGGDAAPDEGAPDVSAPDVSATDVGTRDTGSVLDAGAPDTGMSLNPVVTITQPGDMESGRNARTDIVFVGQAIDYRGVPLSGTSLTWTDSVAGRIGTGTSVSYRLSAGMHTIRLTAMDFDVRMGSASIQLLIEP